jgi:hypothetical protein
MTLSVLSLITRITADEFLSRMLQVAEAIGLPVTTWREGDPTRALFRADSEQLGTLEEAQYNYAKAAFLHTAEEDWKTLRAKETFNVDRDEATFAEPSIDIENAGGGLFELDPGGLIVSAGDQLYENIETITIDPGPAFTLTIALRAKTAGAAGSVGVDDIDTIVSPTLTGVTITGSTAATASDAQSDPGLDDECLASLGALSPNGPFDAYEYVVQNSTLTGVEGITRAKSDGDTTDGTVTVYAATDTAGISSPTIALLQAAVDQWSQPLCTDATVVSGSPQSQAVTITGVPSDGHDTAEAAIAEYMRTVKMGATFYVDAAVSAVRVALTNELNPPAGALTISVPVADTTYGAGVFPVLSAVTFL